MGVPVTLRGWPRALACDRGRLGSAPAGLRVWGKLCRLLQ